MKKLSLILCLAFLPSLAFSASKVALDKAPIDITDKDSLKRGAEAFAGYCFSCHSAKFMRFNRIAKDLEIDESEVANMFIHTRDKKGDKTKIGALMKVSMTDEYAEQAFGIAVPDLSLTARAKGVDWLYTYLRTFYEDSSRPAGSNNLVFPGVGMPHVLASLQGVQEAVYKEEEKDGVKVKHFEKLVLKTPGSMTPEEYDAFVADLVNFMVYLAEPVQVERRSLGVWVLLFLAVFFIPAYLLKKEYWKDVH